MAIWRNFWCILFSWSIARLHSRTLIRLAAGQLKGTWASVKLRCNKAPPYRRASRRGALKIEQGSRRRCSLMNDQSRRDLDFFFFFKLPSERDRCLFVAATSIERRSEREKSNKQCFHGQPRTINRVTSEKPRAEFGPFRLHLRMQFYRVNTRIDLTSIVS